MVAIEPIIDLALQAGALVTRMRRAGLGEIRRKSSPIDLVTEADVACERFLRSGLAALHPDVGFWGEESDTPPSEERFWVVDPIDGTNNFAAGIPYYAVNVALQDGEDTVLGVTIELPARRVYWALAGQGAFLREVDGEVRRLQVSQADRLEHVMLSTGFPYHRAESADNNLAEYGYFLARSQGVRCMGTAAMDLANVASGAQGGYWESTLKPWDAAPGALLVREAGGLVTDYAGKPWQLRTPVLLASNGQPALHEALLQGIQTARATLANRVP